MKCEGLWKNTIEMDSEEIIRLLSTRIYNRRFQFVHYLTFTDEQLEECEQSYQEAKRNGFFDRFHEDVDINLDNIEQEGRGKLLKISGAKEEADIKGLIKRWISRF